MSSGETRGNGRDETGRLLAGRYRVVAQLGRGGMGVVWRAVDEVLGREVAVKELRTYTDADGPELADLRLRMQREARAAARVRHPGVVAVHDVGEVDGRPLIVMELVDGPSLEAVLRKRGPLDPQEAAGIGAKVMDALAAAHQVGVLHRDVKPGNILLDRSGRVLLTDFGIATMEDPGDGAATQLTRTGHLVGSLDYMAPERAQGADPGPASDVWGLGATLYAAVEGASPFRRTSTFSTLTAIVGEPLPEPHRAGALAPVLQRLLDKRPEARPEAEEARALLQAVADGVIGQDSATTTLRGTEASAGRVEPASESDSAGPALPPGFRTAGSAGASAAAEGAGAAPGFGAPEAVGPEAAPRTTTAPGSEAGRATGPTAVHGQGGGQLAGPAAVHGQGGAQHAGPAAVHGQEGAQQAGPAVVHGQGGGQLAGPAAVHGQGGAQQAGPAVVHGQGGGQPAGPAAVHEQGAGQPMGAAAASGFGAPGQGAAGAQGFGGSGQNGAAAQPAGEPGGGQGPYGPGQAGVGQSGVGVPGQAVPPTRDFGASATHGAQGGAPGQPGTPAHGAGPLVSHEQPPTSPMDSSRPPRRKRRALLTAIAVTVVLAVAGTTAALLNGSGGAEADGRFPASGTSAPTSSSASDRTDADRTGSPEPTAEGDRKKTPSAKETSGEGDGSEPTGRASSTATPSPSGGDDSDGSDSGGGAPTIGSSSTPAPACTAIGGGKYNCTVWKTATSYTASGAEAGVLYAGTNYFYCQSNLGRRETSGEWTNVWWAKTDDDSGNTGVYVSDVYVKGGDNDEPVPGLPVC
ncbi:serine/threonine-protein kinase [Streptomyces sp. NPDC048420]|uniref:serine/threonine-protein kinase n=1 Tax=Streptomyces sp. NPDC048420 TaxID=3155755 RepID=UPI003447F0A6